jgi:hypothetical protein
MPGAIGLSAGMTLTWPRPRRRGNARRSKAPARFWGPGSAGSGILTANSAGSATSGQYHFVEYLIGLITTLSCALTVLLGLGVTMGKN